MFNMRRDAYNQIQIKTACLPMADLSRTFAEFGSDWMCGSTRKPISYIKQVS